MAPTLVKYAVIILLILFSAELFYSYREDKHLYRRKDTLNNLAVGAGFIVINTFSKGLMLYSLTWIYQYRLFIIPESWATVMITFLTADFAYYIYHRVSHEVNWFWAAHAVHHSSEEFNFSVGFRLPWITHFTGHFLFWVWIPLLGFDPITTLICIQVGSLYQTFIHTKTVKKLHPFIEYIFNTPSHHRVHHSSNLEYLDKNHGGVFIIWDRLFSTFKEEKTAPVYGMYDKKQGNNVITIVFGGWKDMFKKALNAGKIKNAIFYFIKPPGWSHNGSSFTVKQMKQLHEQNVTVLNTQL